jgi:transposase-like protein
VAFRGRAVAAYESGEGGYIELAGVFGIGYRTLERWVAQYRATESVAPRPRGGGWRSPIDLVLLHAVIREQPDGTSDELCRAYNRRVGRARRTTATSFRRAMGRAGYVLKKNGRARVNRTDPTFGRSARRSSAGSDESTSTGWSRSMRQG